MHHLDTRILSKQLKVSRHSAQQWNQIGKVGKAKLHILVHDADWFKCHFRQLYFRADWSEILFFSMLAFPFCALVFTSAENMLLLPGQCVWRCAQQQSRMTILSLINDKSRRSIKAADKDLGTTVVTSLYLTSATVVGTVKVTEFWQK